MHKPSVSRIGVLTSIAAAMGMGEADFSTAEVFRKQRGPAPHGTRYTTGVYVPGGPRCNVEPTKVRNPKIAANVQMMHEKWLHAFIALQNVKAGKEVTL